MNKFDAKKIMPRYRAISLVMIILAVCVVGKSLYIMTAKRDYWMKVAERQKRDSVTVKPNRGNILSCTGQLLASSLPEFKIYMDFVALKEAKSDSLWDVKVDSICNGLHKIFPDKSAAEFKQHLSEGKAKMKRHWAIYNERINYNTFCEVKDLPMFKLNSNKSGFHWEEFNARQRS